MRKLTKDQNQRIRAARKEFLAARNKYKKTVHAIRSEKRMANLVAQGKLPPTMIPAPTLWNRIKNWFIGVWSRG